MISPLNTDGTRACKPAMLGLAMPPSLVAPVSAVVSREASLCSAFSLAKTSFPCGCFCRKRTGCPGGEGSGLWFCPVECSASLLSKHDSETCRLSTHGESSIRFRVPYAMCTVPPFLSIDRNKGLKCNSVPPGYGSANQGLVNSGHRWIAKTTRTTIHFVVPACSFKHF